jgi:hypothetical protein
MQKANLSELLEDVGQWSIDWAGEVKGVRLDWVFVFKKYMKN